MRRLFDLGGGFELAFIGPEDSGRPTSSFPTSSLQKGLVLCEGRHDLSGEGVGFGVPVLKRGARAVFAGSAEVTIEQGDGETPRPVVVWYVLDRLERLGGRRRSVVFLRPLDWAREAFALVYRRVPPLRRLLLACSNGVRWMLRVHTRFEQVAPVARVGVTYSLGQEGELCVSADLSGLPASVTQVVLMNELDAAHFDSWANDDGESAEGRAIGAWDPVGAGWSRFVSAESGFSFALAARPDPDVPGVRLFRGREQARGRLAWAGFGYTLPPGPDRFTYSIRFAHEEPSS